MSQTAEVINLEARRPPVVVDVDNGYMRTALELQDMLCLADVSGREARVCHAIMRLTYGWNKSKDNITNTQIAEKTRIASNHVATILKSLAARKIIIIGSGHYHELGMNKAVSEWQINKVTKPQKSQNREPLNNPKTGLKNPKTGSDNPKTGTNKSLNREPPKTTDTLTKDIITKDSSGNDSARAILTYLNDKTGKQFKQVKSNLDLINARLKDFTADELRTIVDNMTAKWGGDPKWSEYLRPATLFQASKADGYLNATPVTRQAFAQTDYSAGTEGFASV